MKPKNFRVVFKREFLSFFNSPTAYIVVTVFLLVAGWMFFQQFFLIGQASLRPLFAFVSILFMFFAPAITMRLVAEERKTKTFSLLLTLPLSNAEIILGKFLAAWALLGVGLLLTVPYAFTVSALGTMDWGPVVGGYLGALLMGGAYLAIGMFCTSLTANQIVAFILGLGMCFVFFILGKVLIFLPEGIATVVEYFSVDYHFQNIARGVIDLRDLVFYISFIAAFLSYSTFAIQSEKWR